MKTLTPVNSIQEALNLGFKYVIAERNHYRGNSKGEIYTNLTTHADVTLSHFNYEDRGIEAMYATNLEVVNMVKQRQRVLGLISIVKFSMSDYSKLYTGQRYQYLKSKMVFGTWRSVFGWVTVNPDGGAYNFDKKTFPTRHKKILTFLEQKLRETDIISSTYSIIN